MPFHPTPAPTVAQPGASQILAGLRADPLTAGVVGLLEAGGGAELEEISLDALAGLFTVATTQAALPRTYSIYRGDGIVPGDGSQFEIISQLVFAETPMMYDFWLRLTATGAATIDTACIYLMPGPDGEQNTVVLTQDIQGINTNQVTFYGRLLTTWADLGPKTVEVGSETSDGTPLSELYGIVTSTPTLGGSL